MASRKALVVGIDQYKDCPLCGCCNDAEEIGNLLKKNGTGAPNFSVKIEKNVPDQQTLRGLVRDCFDGDADVALFYYSGHGFINSFGGYLATPDFYINNNGISLQEILGIINHSKCRDKVVILDSCYAGFLGNTSVEERETAILTEGVTILTSCRSAEKSIEVGGHGLFTSLLIEALKGGAADITGHITPGGIYAYIDKALGPWEQRPVFKTNVTRFTSLRDVVPQVDISVIRRLCEYFHSETEEFKLDPSFEPTNSPLVKHEVIKPYANDANTRIFSDLQKLEGIGLVVPVSEEHMYFAAMKSKSCALSVIGKQYWRLVEKGVI